MMVADTSTTKNHSNDDHLELLYPISVGSPYELLAEGLNCQIFCSDHEWRQARFNPALIGGSDIAAILGISPFKTALGIWNQKTGRAPVKEVTDAQQWGLRLETPILEEWARIVRPASFDISKSLIIRDGWKAASPDGLAVVDGKLVIVEAKTVSAWLKDEWESDVPEFYLTQVLWYMHVTGVPRADFFVLIGGQETVGPLSIYAEDYANHIDAIVERVDIWRTEHLVEHNVPTALAPDDAFNLNWAYLPDSDTMTALPAELVSQYIDAKTDERELTKRIEVLQTLIKTTLKENQVGTVDGVNAITWKSPKAATPQNRKKALLQAIDKANSEIALIDAGNWVAPKPTRRLNIVKAYRELVERGNDE